MKTGRLLHGGAQLAFDAVDATTHIVEGMVRNIAATSWPFGRAPEGPAHGVSGFVHESARTINAAARTGTHTALATVRPLLDRTSQSGPYREAAVSALNGVCGDHLASTGNALAIDMRLRVMLPPDAPSGSTAAAPALESPNSPATAGRLARLLELNNRFAEVYPQPNALAESTFTPGKRLLIAVHGLCMHDRIWTSRHQNHVETLAQTHGYTPVYVLYNSGKHISSNGRELSQQLTELIHGWPQPVESVVLMGFSMGGLVVRSAMRVASEQSHPWLEKVTKALYVGTPHHGAVMERGGFWLQRGLGVSPYTAPLSALGRIRSAGITDLRHGNVRDDDWQHHDEHDDHTDRRVPTPLPTGIEHFALGATLSKRPGQSLGRLLGDGLVHPSSATGRHPRPLLHLAFPEGHTRILYNLGHMAMLHDARVLDQLTRWMGDSN